MATSSVSRYFRIMDCIPLRKMVLMNQTSYIHVDHMTCIRRKAQHLSTTKQSLRKTEKTNDVCSQIAPRAEKRLEGCKVKRVTVQSLLENIGFKVGKKNARIDVTKLSVEQVKKILSFLDEIGIEHQDKGKIISRRPGILTAKENLLRMRVEVMKKAGIYPESVAYVVRESPGVLTGRTEISLPDKVKFFENLRVKPKFTTDEILHVLTKCPHLIASYTVKSLEEKIQLFEKELKFNKHHIKNLILKQPSVLTFSEEAILKKYNYCFENMNLSPSSIARCPRVFQCSLKRIRERHQFLKHVGRITDEMRIDDYGLGLIVTTSDKQFVEKVAKTSMEDFKSFINNIDSIISCANEIELNSKQYKEGKTEGNEQNQPTAET